MARKHGLVPRNGEKHPLFKTWCEMRYRCENPLKDNFKYYGGRGIKVCDKWRNDFAAFVFDMGPRPEGATLDRIDRDGNYCPDNCRWADKKTQANNTSANRIIECDGERLTLAQWSRRTGLRIGTIWKRLDDGWSVKTALRTPRYSRRDEL